MLILKNGHILLNSKRGKEKGGKREVCLGGQGE